MFNHCERLERSRNALKLQNTLHMFNNTDYKVSSAEKNLL